MRGYVFDVPLANDRGVHWQKIVINEFRRHLYSSHWQSGTRLLENYAAGRSSNFIFASGGTLFGTFVSFFSYPSLPVYPMKMILKTQIRCSKSNGELYCRLKELISCQLSNLEVQFRIFKINLRQSRLENNLNLNTVKSYTGWSQISQHCGSSSCQWIQVFT